ncbi:MAG: ribonuclease HII [Candidatus Marinimicrobia bacterium]|nr:ribonuclease HII [Candidatus Neomarinimicrobiota bacterium]
MNNQLITFDKNESKNIQYLAGVDEAGRGPIAGPVVAGSVIIDKENERINDSKKMTEKRRNEAYKWITENAIAWSFSVVGVETIDSINILQASLLAMERAVGKLKITPNKLLIDGNKIPRNLENAEAIIGGDGKSFSIACASIIAKVTRDDIMKRWHKVYDNYAFDQHKGYGTKLHFSLVNDSLPSPIHRLGFAPIKDFNFPRYPNRITLGKWGENWAIYYLMKKKYKFIERNYYAGKLGEIDIIMKKGERYIFVEVKTKGPGDYYDVAESITRVKVAKMLKCCDLYFYNKEIEEFEVGFDAIIVDAKNWRNPKIEHFEDINY